MAPVVIVAQASLPAIRLWIDLQRLSMAGRDAHPTIVNKSPYLKTPMWADTRVRPYNKSLSNINIFGLAYSPLLS